MQLAQRGMTYVEQAVMLVILGILTAAAFPRFAAMQSAAREALVNSLGGNIRAAAQHAHVTWIVKGKPATIDMEDQSITMLNGYPDQASIDDTLMDYTGFQYTNLITAQFTKDGAPSPSTCMVSYAAASLVSRPIILVITSGC